jgi:ligand-binding sensor domain-containing protein
LIQIVSMKNMTTFFIAASLLLNPACADMSNSKKENLVDTTNAANTNDTLNFKSGTRSILQDSKGNYWIGSDSEGVCNYDGKTFTYYSTDNGLCGNQVIYIREDETGLIWFGTSKGLCNFDGTKFTTPEKSSPVSITTNTNYDTWSVNATDVWFPGNNNQELIRVTQGKSYHLKYPFQIPVKGNSVDYGITGISKSKNGGLWIAHYAGVNYYDGKTIQYINDSTEHFDGKSRYMHVRSMIEDSKGRLWIGNNGIGVQLKEKDTIVHFSEKNNLVKGKVFGAKSPEGTLMHVFAIREDSKGNIWFGDRDTGAWRFDGKEIKNFILDPSLNTQHIWDIYEDKSGNLLFASGDRGVYKFNGNGFDRAF